MKWFLAAINALCVIIIILLTSIQIPAFDLNFYSKEYDKYTIPSQISISKSDLMKVTVKMLDYMHGREDNLIVGAVIDGQEREFFNEREKRHMIDVKYLFSAGFAIRTYAIAIFCITLLVLVLMKAELRMIAKSYLISFGVFFASLLALALLISINFESAFIIFHEIFFNNDLWLLDQRTDLLINIVPLDFFIDIAVYIAVIFGVAISVIIGVLVLYLCRLRIIKSPRR